MKKFYSTSANFISINEISYDKEAFLHSQMNRLPDGNLM